MNKTPEKTRATSLAEMDERQAKLFTEENFAQAMKFKLQPTDIVITPYAKCGTTWLQQIVHTLRTRGDMDFDDISRVVPWIETSPALGIDLDAPQKAEPRAFKSHLDANAIPKGGRYINSVRNPGDALISIHKFMEGWFLEPGAVTLEDLARNRFFKSGEYWKHLLSWWYRRNDPDVLFLAYEHMKTDIRGAIKRIAKFIEVELDEELLDLTEKHASLDFMLKHKDRFDDVLMRTLSEEKAGIPEGSDSSKVRLGKVGGSLSQEVKDGLHEIWEREITRTIGYASYEALIADLG